MSFRIMKEKLISFNGFWEGTSTLTPHSVSHLSGAKEQTKQMMEGLPISPPGAGVGPGGPDLPMK